MAIFEFIEGWYNSHRRHSSLAHLSPIAFERRFTGSAFIPVPTPLPESHDAHP
ncbi:hypothetical protein L6Q96_14510 [Candidatus Binatia bacterium]|nr:hypothetical protein [Candidatus Binatia bacterium]